MFKITSFFAVAVATFAFALLMAGVNGMDPPDPGEEDMITYKTLSLKERGEVDAFLLSFMDFDQNTPWLHPRFHESVWQARFNALPDDEREMAVRDFGDEPWLDLEFEYFEFSYWYRRLGRSTHLNVQRNLRPQENAQFTPNRAEVRQVIQFLRQQRIAFRAGERLIPDGREARQNMAVNDTRTNSSVGQKRKQSDMPTVIIDVDAAEQRRFSNEALFSVLSVEVQRELLDMFETHKSLGGDEEFVWQAEDFHYWIIQIRRDKLSREQQREIENALGELTRNNMQDYIRYEQVVRFMELEQHQQDAITNIMLADNIDIEMASNQLDISLRPGQLFHNFNEDEEPSKSLYEKVSNKVESTAESLTSALKSTANALTERYFYSVNRGADFHRNNNRMVIEKVKKLIEDLEVQYQTFSSEIGEDDTHALQIMDTADVMLKEINRLKTEILGPLEVMDRENLYHRVPPEISPDTLYDALRNLDSFKEEAEIQSNEVAEAQSALPFSLYDHLLQKFQKRSFGEELEIPNPYKDATQLNQCVNEGVSDAVKDAIMNITELDENGDELAKRASDDDYLITNGIVPVHSVLDRRPIDDDPLGRNEEEENRNAHKIEEWAQVEAILVTYQGVGGMPLPFEPVIKFFLGKPAKPVTVKLLVRTRDESSRLYFTRLYPFGPAEPNFVSDENGNPYYNIDVAEDDGTGFCDPEYFNEDHIPADVEELETVEDLEPSTSKPSQDSGAKPRKDRKGKAVRIHFTQTNVDEIEQKIVSKRTEIQNANPDMKGTLRKELNTLMNRRSYIKRAMKDTFRPDGMNEITDERLIIGRGKEDANFRKHLDLINKVYSGENPLPVIEPVEVRDRHIMIQDQELPPARIGVQTTTDYPYTVTRVGEGFPAYGNIPVGATITEINGLSTEDMAYLEFSYLLRGDDRSTVIITYKTPDQTIHHVTLTRIINKVAKAAPPRPVVPCSLKRKVQKIAPSDGGGSVIPSVQRPPDSNPSELPPGRVPDWSNIGGSGVPLVSSFAGNRAGNVQNTKQKAKGEPKKKTKAFVGNGNVLGGQASQAPPQEAPPVVPLVQASPLPVIQTPVVRSPRPIVPDPNFNGIEAYRNRWITAIGQSKVVKAVAVSVTEVDVYEKEVKDGKERLKKTRIDLMKTNSVHVMAKYRQPAQWAVEIFRTYPNHQVWPKVEEKTKNPPKKKPKKGDGGGGAGDGGGDGGDTESDS